MKRTVSVLLACLLLCGLAACGTTIEQPTETQAITEIAEPEITTQVVDAEYTTQPAEPEYTTKIVEAMIDPDFDAEGLFKRLEGVWDTPRPEIEGIPYGFTSFIYRDGKPSLLCGAYESETSGFATLTGGRENEDGTVTLYFLYPAFDDQDNNPVPERTDSLQIDLAGIDNGKLHFQQTNIWRTYEWETRTYRCKTLQEAGLRLY